MNADSCVHGWTSPPECPSCLLIERDMLSEAFRHQGDKLLKAQQECESLSRTKSERDTLEQLCLELVAGINSMSELLIEHHACSDDDTGSLICNVCASKTGNRLWKEADKAKEAWHKWDKLKYGNAF